MKSYLKCSDIRLIAWVCGGGTQAITPRLRGALPEAKREGSVMGKMLKYRILLLYCIIATNVCNAQPNRSDIGNTPNNIIEEYINTEGQKVIRYGTADQTDSVMIFSPTGYLIEVQYGFGMSDIPHNFVLDKTYWENLRAIRITKDTLLVVDGHRIYPSWWEATYHSNGALLDKGHYHGSLGLMVGQWHYYDSTGYLIEERIHAPVCFDDDGMYDGYNSYITVRTFYPNGILREKKIFTYPSEADNIPKGIWKYYNERGVLYKTEEYENGNLIKTIIK